MNKFKKRYVLAEGNPIYGMFGQTLAYAGLVNELGWPINLKWPLGTTFNPQWNGNKTPQYRLVLEKLKKRKSRAK